MCDISGHEDKFVLDKSGFQFFKCPVSVDEWDDESVVKTYLPSLTEWAVSRLGGERGLVYSFNVSSYRVLLRNDASQS